MNNKAPRTVYACQTCGYQSAKWLGKCPDCNTWNSFAEERERELAKTGTAAKRSGLKLRESKPIAFTAIEAQDEARNVTGIEEFDRVCMVDVQPHYFPGLDRVDLVIDHHPEQHGYNAVFKDIALPLYAVLMPQADGKVKVLGVYDEGKINDPAKFAAFLKDALEKAKPKK